ncbi:hypothetical protein PPYR_06525 [Photinus pyralis]|uniref:RNA helicase n=1 Tax=Photinus pyralis TaxID=7054 RepID=A0A5N4ATZ9_PHOPY|nr:ATP-dependent DNA/RNA helicase DHX36-like [Photinus pyralis]KAB0800786.1 hypothetical protein PPYR_06525 [Photinus pyralis]
MNFIRMWTYGFYLHNCKIRLKSKPFLVGIECRRSDCVKLVPNFQSNNRNDLSMSSRPSRQEFVSDGAIDVFPRETLRWFFSLVSDQLKSPALIEEETIFKLKPFVYLSTVNVLWPKPLSFSSYGINETDALRNASKNVLYWLKSNTYMDSHHKPILNSQHHILTTGQRLFYSTSTQRTNATNVARTEAVDTDKIKSLFPHPKGVLHNWFLLVSNALEDPKLKISPTYKSVKAGKNAVLWECVYTLKWPRSGQFSATANRKQDAAHKAALEALIWLYHNKLLNAKGQPILPENVVVPPEEEKCRKLRVGANEYQSMTSIAESVKSGEVRAILENFTSCNQEENMPVIEEWVQSDVPQQQYTDRNFYVAKEPTRLPISDYKEELIGLLARNSVVIIKGEPGCGKSTRVPQYVMEAWARDLGAANSPCRIIVTQPRRIAAASLAERVASERGESVGSTVGYNVRFNTKFSKKTGHIMYCTSGILLNRLKTDPKLSDCSHIILDEAHERDVTIDLLLILVRRALTLNPKLKVLVMSATMDAELFRDYFGDAPILNIPGFTHPVEQYFLTDEKLPSFQMCMSKIPRVLPKDVADCIKFIHKKKPEGAILCFLPGWEDITKVKDLLPPRTDMVTLCVHSRLSMAEQRKIFSKAPPGVRKVILATNIAETSITIDDVVYVIDPGIQKEERLDEQKGIVCIDYHWISKASAKQRKGRAGRCQHGECYHLYPQFHHDSFMEYSIPEILRTSLTKIVLNSKIYSNNMKAIDFLQRLITPPKKAAIESAVQELKDLELLDEHENLTPLGRTLSHFHLHPKLGKAMVNAVLFKCVTPIVDIVTLYSDESALFSNDLLDKARITDHLRKESATSDHLAMMQLFEKWLYYIESQDYRMADAMCQDLGLVQPKLFTLQKLRSVHLDYLHKGLYDVLPISDDLSDYDELVKAVLLSGVGNLLRRREWDIVKGRRRNKPALVTRHNQRATVSSSSVNAMTRKLPPDFLVYINEIILNVRKTSLIRETSTVSSLAVLFFAPGEIELHEIKSKDASSDQVLLKLGKSDIEFHCDRRHALAIKECKEAIEKYKQYYIFQLTTGNSYSVVINNAWKRVLKHLMVALKTDS